MYIGLSTCRLVSFDTFCVVSLFQVLVHASFYVHFIVHRSLYIYTGLFTGKQGSFDTFCVVSLFQVMVHDSFYDVRGRAQVSFGFILLYKGQLTHK